MSLPTRPALVLALLSAAIATPCTATAATPVLSPSQVQMSAKLQAQKQAKRQALNQNVQYNLDVKAPELKRITLAKTSVRVSEFSPGELMVDLVATDNLTGVASVSVVVQSVDTGWELSADKSIALPVGRASMGVPVSFFGEVPAGEWRVTSVILRDANNNVKIYDADALSALGNTSFQVDSRSRSDGIAPELTSGAVLTPMVSRSKPPKGEYPTNRARVGLSLSVTDTGTSSVSGVSSAYVTLCDEFGWECLYLSGTALKPGVASGTIVVGSTVSEWTSSARFTVSSAQVYDRQGYSRTYYSWDTDFNAMFGGDASITVTE